MPLPRLTPPKNSISIPTFIPRVAIIDDIVEGEITLIGTTVPITFIVGQSVKIVIPPPQLATMTAPAYDYGMPEINGMTGFIVMIDPNIPDQFFIDIDSRFFQPFNYQPNATQLAQAVPVGERTLQLFGAWRNALGPPSPFGGENPLT
jgi:hypothetical protein